MKQLTTQILLNQYYRDSRIETVLSNTILNLKRLKIRVTNSEIFQLFQFSNCKILSFSNHHQHFIVIYFLCGLYFIASPEYFLTTQDCGTIDLQVYHQAILQPVVKSCATCTINVVRTT